MLGCSSSGSRPEPSVGGVALVVNGFAGTLGHYLTPERHYERAVFDALARHGFAVEGFNDRAHGTSDRDATDRAQATQDKEHQGRFKHALS